MVSAEVGDALRLGIVSSIGLSLLRDPEPCPLTFYHGTQHFDCGTLSRCIFVDETNYGHYPCLEPFSSPRLAISEDLPRQSDADTIPTTIYLFGHIYPVALDGTFDGRVLHIQETLS
jgi:hypothetical protein